MDSHEIAKFFEPSITSIVEAVKTQMITAHHPVKVRGFLAARAEKCALADSLACQTVFLVGGFSASPWLFEKVKAAIEPLGVKVSRPDTHVYV